ncbi:MAG: hypothetical protein WBM50_02045 [Acidimicrobiales bacterium]
MSEPVRNRCRPWELTEDDVASAVGRIGARDAGLAEEAEHVIGSLTWGEGPGVISQSGLQEWLWYVVPTKYLTDEVGYMGRLAETAAVLFDELGLHGYAAICRSDETAKVHQAFDRSDPAGRSAMRKAIERSGVDAPDLDAFAWSSVMRTEEANARSAVEAALEDAIYTGEMTVGAKAWREVQARVCRRVLDGDHPLMPGQSWRTAVVTERIESWVSAAEPRSPTLLEARAQIANRLLHPVEPPPEANVAVRPLVWLMERWGDEQPLTQAGYLKPAFVQSLQADRPWHDPFPLDRRVRNEVDDHVLHDLRGWLQRVGALRKHKAGLRRTPLGREIASDSESAWSVMTRNLVVGDDWVRFVAETGLLFFLGQDDPVSDNAAPAFIRACATDMGWQTTIDGITEPPSLRDVSWTLADARHVWDACTLTETSGDWGSRRISLTDIGRAAALSHLRHVAAGPKDSPW